MKKAIVLLLALAMVGMVFAEGAAYSMTGYGQLKWGYDVNTNKHGFNNSTSFELTFPLVAGATAGASGENVYGKISVTGINLAIYQDGSEGSVIDNYDGDGYYDTLEAKIVAGDAYVKIASAPTLRQNNASHFSPFADADADYLDRGVADTITTKGGFTVGYSLGELGSVSAMIASIGDWVGAAATDDVYGWVDADDDPTTAPTWGVETAGTAAVAANDKYAAAFGLTLTPVEMVTITGGFQYDMASEGAGATVKVALAPMTGVTAYVAADLDMPKSPAKMQMDVRGNVAATFGKTTVGADVYYKDVGTTAKVLDAKLAVSDSGTVANLTGGLSVYAMQLIADPAKDPMWLGVAENVAYKVALTDATYVKPYQALVYDLSKTTNNMYFKVGAEAKLMANTLFTLQYVAGKYGNKTFPGGGFVTTGMDTDKGLLTFTTKISF
jgi:carbon monoxide dehydrogenase subunit G